MQPVFVEGSRYRGPGARRVMSGTPPVPSTSWRAYDRCRRRPGARRPRNMRQLQPLGGLKKVRSASAVNAESSAAAMTLVTSRSSSGIGANSSEWRTATADPRRFPSSRSMSELYLAMITTRSRPFPSAPAARPAPLDRTDRCGRLFPNSAWAFVDEKHPAQLDRRLSVLTAVIALVPATKLCATSHEFGPAQ